MKPIQFTPLLLSVIICFSAGVLGSLFTVNAIPTWYESLNKPFFNPPNWVFGPVWSTLYMLMGVSLYIIWQKKINKQLKQKALLFFFIQLILNAVWSIAFFGLQSPLLGLIVIAALWIFIFLTIKSFLSISKPAGYLLFPYLVWVSFAAILNLYIVILNS